MNGIDKRVEVALKTLLRAQIVTSINCWNKKSRGGAWGVENNRSVEKIDDFVRVGWIYEQFCFCAVILDKYLTKNDKT